VVTNITAERFAASTLMEEELETLVSFTPDSVVSAAEGRI
jgi:hypothetical protein